MTLEDLAEHTAEVVEPIKYDFKATADDPGLTLWEVGARGGCSELLAAPLTPQCPPNGQGLTALLALGIIESVERVHGVDVLTLEHNSTEYLHILIEALRLAFADSGYSAVVAADPFSPVLCY